MALYYSALFFLKESLNYKRCLLYTSNTVGSLKGGGSVQGQGGDGFFDAQLHIDAGQSNGQRDGTGETTAGIQVGSECHSTTGVNHFTTSCVGLLIQKYWISILKLFILQILSFISR